MKFILCGALLASVFATSAEASEPSKISLGGAQSFAVLAATTVTNLGATKVIGNLGVSPGTAVTGFPPGSVTGGTIRVWPDAIAIQAQIDANKAYASAKGQPCKTNMTGVDLGGKTLKPGVYCFNSSAFLTGTLTLDARGVATPIFIFQMGSTLITGANSKVVILKSPGCVCNQVYWQVGSSATIGTSSSMVGNILALTSITLVHGTRVEGRALALNGAVTMDTNNVTIVGF